MKRKSRLVQRKRKEKRMAISNFSYYVGGVVRQKRKSLKLSQAEIAETLGMAQSALARVELGQRALSLLEAFNLARTLKFPVEEFFPVLPEEPSHEA